MSADRRARTAYCRRDRLIGSLRFPPAARAGCSRHVRSAAELSGLAAHQLRAVRCAAHAAGAWADGRNRAAEEFEQSGGGSARPRRARDAETVSKAPARRHGGGVELAGAWT